MQIEAIEQELVFQAQEPVQLVDGQQGPQREWVVQNNGVDRIRENNRGVIQRYEGLVNVPAQQQMVVGGSITRSGERC